VSVLAGLTAAGHAELPACARIAALLTKNRPQGHLFVFWRGAADFCGGGESDGDGTTMERPIGSARCFGGSRARRTGGGVDLGLDMTLMGGLALAIALEGILDMTLMGGLDTTRRAAVAAAAAAAADAAADDCRSPLVCGRARQ
jgi:hypothetical protein